MYQYKVFGAGEYYRRGVRDRFRDWFTSSSPYNDSLNSTSSLEPQAKYIGQLPQYQVSESTYVYR